VFNCGRYYAESFIFKSDFESKTVTSIDFSGNLQIWLFIFLSPIRRRKIEEAGEIKEVRYMRSHISVEQINNAL
jgi:hypothetical protein